MTSFIVSVCRCFDREKEEETRLNNEENECVLFCQVLHGIRVTDNIMNYKVAGNKSVLVSNNL